MPEPTALREVVERDGARCQALLDEVERVVIGQRALLEHMLLGALCEGHVLLEGVPGLAKTLAARTFAAAVRGSFTRVQFTPDLLPGDVTGTEVFDPDGRRFVPRLGPVVTNILLADEINRAPAKVQAALLEAMEERQVTVGGQTYPLPRPFLVLATQNPIEQEGTYPLPEAQVDRFLFKVLVEYPGHADELAVVDAHLAAEPAAVRSVLAPDELAEMAAGARAVHVDPRIREYAVRLVRATRHGARDGVAGFAAWVRYGASPRAAIALARSAQALALVRGRAYVIPEDVKEVAPAVLRHRLILSLEAQAEQVDVEQLVRELLMAVELP